MRATVIAMANVDLGTLFDTPAKQHVFFRAVQVDCTKTLGTYADEGGLENVSGNILNH